MWRMLQSFLAGVAFRLADLWSQRSFDVLRLRLARSYAKGVVGARRLFLLYLGVIGALLLGMTGFIGLHVGLFLVVPFSLETKGVILLFLSLLYLIVGYAIVRQAVVRTTWMRLSKADQWLRQATGEEP